MPAMKYFMPSVNHIGVGCLAMAVTDIAKMGLKKALLVTDRVLNELGMAGEVAELLGKKQISSILFDGVQPNPTIAHVESGLALLKEHECDCIISLGGGSPHDCGKAIALVAANGGEVKNYVGMDRSKTPALPLIAINTTAGTASEMTRFALIVDEEAHAKINITDQHITPVMSVNDPALMVKLPPAVTAQTGMDALTHAIEGYLSMAATHLTNSTALAAIELIATNLPRAVEDGENLQVREDMAYGQLLAGMTFNNAGLGYTHAIAHVIGAKYDLPHGLCNGVMLPWVMTFNSPVCLPKMANIARAMGREVDGLSPQDAAQQAVLAVRELADRIGIPPRMRDLDIPEQDLEQIAKKAKRDVAGITNPRPGKVKDILGICQQGW